VYFYLLVKQIQVIPEKMGRKRKRGRQKGTRKQSVTPQHAAKRAEAKRRRLEASKEEKLRETQEKLKPNRGHNYARRKDSVRLLLLMLVSAFLECNSTAEDHEPAKDPYATAYQQVATQAYCSENFLRGLWERYEAGGMADIESPEKRGRKKRPPERVYEGSQFSTDDVADLERWVIDLNSTQGGVTLKRLKERFLTMKNLKVRTAAIRKTLHRLGYKWGPAKKMGKLRKCVSRTARIRQYLLEYSEALRLQRDGDGDGCEYVIVYMDESYIHQRHTSGHTWAKKNENIIRTGGGLGSRCIVVHAITEDGLLFKPGSERVANDSHELKEKRYTAEWVFVGPVKKGDYHRNMNEKNFLRWTTERLIPSFEQTYPGKKMILVLDNAPYHHIRADNFIDTLKLNRSDLFNELILTADIKTLTVERGGRDTEMDLVKLRNTKRGSKNAPYNRELQDALKAFVNEHPEYQEDKLEKLFDSKGFRLIFTPPYTPALQPIELLWAEVKRRVANRFEYGRTIRQTRQQMLDAFYGIEADKESEDDEGVGLDALGENSERKAITKELVCSYIEHSKKACNEFIKSDNLLKGTLTNLKEVKPSSAQMSQQDKDSLEESSEFPELLDESDSYFVGDRADDDDVDDSSSSSSDSEESDAEADEGASGMFDEQ